MPFNVVSNSNGSLGIVDDFTFQEQANVSKFGLYPNYKNKVVWYDDFLGDILDTSYSGAKGSDGSAVVPAISAGVNGIVHFVTGAAGTTMAADGSSLTHELNWKANQGNLVMEARFRANASVASGCYNIGFSAKDATGTLEMPFTLSTTTFTSNATDAVVFVFDTAATTKTWRCIGVKADTDSTSIDSGIAPVADTWQRFRIELDTSGNATFYINDALVGTVANAVTATVALTPIIAVVTRSAASKTADADYLYVAADRT